MTHRIEYSEAFLQDVRERVEYLRGQDVSQATIDRWFGELFDTIESLSESPKRHPVDGMQAGAAGVETRKLVYGQNLVFYRVDDEAKQVRLDKFMHASRDRSSEQSRDLQPKQSEARRCSGPERGGDAGDLDR